MPTPSPKLMALIEPEARIACIMRLAAQLPPNDNLPAEAL
ncbi:hypothetical protein NBRC3188_1393 [Acetobacter pasteurianus NBRC 3188]|uniref:Uncharacterized protein n=1 Tax=Acetobacter pasteurianus NBRC 3188 TaxID=1226663 RepID=A0A401WTS4_ACEPA|nr:hypothetical protein NBRC3188_1393 [Acetobacter pasteurianus NBRC 3188]